MYKSFLSFILLTLIALQSVNVLADAFHSHDDTSFTNTSSHELISGVAPLFSEIEEPAPVSGACDMHEACHCHCSLQLHYLPDSGLGLSKSSVTNLFNGYFHNQLLDSQPSSLFRPPRA